MDPLGILRALVGIPLVLWLPGRAWVDVLIPTVRGRIERFAFSVALSVSMIVLAMYLLNVALGVKITAWTVVLASLALTAGGFGLASFLRGRSRVTTGARNEAP